MKTGPRARIAACALGAALALACGTSLAYFTATGSGATTTPVASLSGPVIAGAEAAAGGTVSLSWGGVTAPGSGAVTYFVTRDGGNPGGTCAAPAVPTAATSCVDKEVAPGEHTYVVTAVWRTWRTAGAPRTANVTVGAPARLALSASSANPVAGTAVNLTVTAQDSAGNTATTYTGLKNLTFGGAAASPSGTAATVASSSGAATPFGTATAISFTNGVATVSGASNGLLRVYRAGPAAVTAGDGTLATGSPLNLTVAPAALSKFALTPESATPVAGAADPLTITAQDAYGNMVTGHQGSKSLTFSGGSASGAGNLPTVSDSSGKAVAFGTATTISFNAGVAAVAAGANGAMRLYKTGAQSIGVAEGAITSATVTVTPTPATAAKLVLSSSAATVVAGATVNLTITAQDPYANVATAYAGSKSLTFGGAAASPGGSAPTIVNSAGTPVPVGTATAISFTGGVASVSSAKNGVFKPTRAETAALTVTDGAVSTASPAAITVSPATATKLGFVGLKASAGTVSSVCFDTCTVTGLGKSGTVEAAIAVGDTYGNTVSNIGSGHAVAVTSSFGSLLNDKQTFPATGAAVSPLKFRLTAPATGGFNGTVKATVSLGTAYTAATATVSK
jgi:hypothetical protein